MKSFVPVIIIAAIAIIYLVFSSLLSGNGIVALEENSDIVIGSIQPLTKSTVAIGEQVREGIELAVEEINNSNGINGKALRVIMEDDQCDAAMAITAFEKLVSIDKVKIIIGPTCSTNVLAVASKANQKKVIILTTVASTDNITLAGDYVFRNTPSGRDYSYAMAEFAFGNLKARTASAVYVNLDNGIDFKNDFSKRFTEFGGKILGAESIEKDQTDFRAELTKIKNQNPDVIFLASQVNQAFVIRQIREIGINKQIIGPVSIENPEVLTAGTASDGIIYAGVSLDKNNPKIMAFEKKYLKKYGKKPGFRTAVSYDAAMMVAGLLEQCNNDVGCVKNGLYATKNYEGVSGLTSFDEFGDVKKPLAIKIVRNGEFADYFN